MCYGDPTLMPSSKPDYFPKAPNTITLGGRPSTYKFWGKQTCICSILSDPPKFIFFLHAECTNSILAASKVLAVSSINSKV